ncbi:MAG TPA: TonB C-terminal domain-containing protein, partial [Myxococcales bacterium]|nr:TonB C-terminal domain-containing protein [Myxococcales bacterium]
TSEEHAGAVAEEAGRVKDRVDGWLAADQGRHQVAMGLVDPYFGQVRGALQAAVERGLPDGMPGRNVGQQLIDSVLSGASSFGKTGNPYGEGQVPNAEPAEREFGPARETARRYQGSDPTKGSYGDVPIHGLSSEQMQQCIDQGKLLDDFLSGKFGDGLTAVVELSQAPDGSVQGVRLVATSGLPAYDRHVLGVAPSALEHLPPPPEKGFGIKPGGLKSLWAFEGRVKFKRPLKEWNPLTGSLTGTLVGALYGLACPGLGPPVTFDAATGELELIDLAHPKFTCKVKLVRVE